MRKVLVNKDGLVVNAIEIEERADWQPPEGCQLLDQNKSDKADIGDKVIGNTLTKPSFTDRQGKTVIPEPISLN